jgi:nicotinate-nucleotide--dimethylbenzimidazole phosphoribosyltransferase
MDKMLDFSSFDALRAQLGAALPMADETAAKAATARQASLTKPPGSLGTLEDIAIFMAGWQARERPTIGKAQALVFAGNHGVCARGVNPFPQEVTVQMVANFEAGGAAINQLCRASGADLSVIALDLDRPTRDLSREAAMDEREVLDAMKRGAEAVDPEADILALGEMGIGNSTVAAALATALFGGPASRWAGPGTGSDAAGVSLKAQVVDEAIALHRPDPSDGLSILRTLGGREQAAICGAILAARMRRQPVILDGFICTAAAAALSPYQGALSHCLAGHCSAEPGHRLLLEALGLKPILTLDMRLGEGSGAALALGIVRAALGVHEGMATFAEAGVSGG